jgi:hypothetical protein
MFVRPYPMRVGEARTQGRHPKDSFWGACFLNSQRQTFPTRQVYSSVKRS